jgi:hypothetical protein
VGQITGTVCTAARKVDLLETFNKLLFETADQEKKVLIFIDEANALSPATLESLRLLTNMQEDDRNLFTLVLAGQMELAKRLEHPRRANLFQRIGAYNRIEKIESPAVLRDYVETRLRLAGGSGMFFTESAFSALWEHSEHGVPRLVNKICKLCMKAGETNDFPVIDEEVVSQIGERFQRLTGHAAREKVSRPPALESPPAVAEEPPRKTGEPSGEVSLETDIGSLRIKIGIPPEILRQASTATHEARVKIAGALAAQNLQKYPQQAFSSAQDPVVLWSDVRRSILNAFEAHTATAR